ncbi:MAG: Tol biopolymer transport system component [Gammaproteobacteria bacterium]|jgi:Tol biopolymer transport system component
MTFTAGQSLSFYDILGPLGAGAMGEVYLAKDTRLEREVAIKVLPEHFAADEERLRRFEREAKSLASLNHPNVAQIFSVDRSGDTCFLVLELVPGETLEERIARGILPIEEAVDVCSQIADGLEAAHEAGVIHRDLKPANVRITPDGKVKVLDFGLAKPTGPDADTESTSDSVLATEAGRLLGTPIYMAPEQARGKPIDRRVDVWAFGCVLFECLTGKRAFDGDSMADVLAAVVHEEAGLERLPEATPAHVRNLIERCLHKDSRQRLRDMGEARWILETGASGATNLTGVTLAGSSQSSGLRVARAVACALACALLGGLAVRTLWPSKGVALSAARRVQSELVAPLGTHVDPYKGPPAVSPDGARVAFSAIDELGQSALWVRELDDGEVHRLPGTEGGENPFWAPDGQQLGFHNPKGIQVIGIDESRPRVVLEGSEFSGASWNEAGTILYAQNVGPIMSVDVDGGTPKFVFDPEPENPEAWGLWPSYLPDGRGFLFSIQDRTGVSSGLYACRLGSTDAQLLSNDVSNAYYVEPGRLVYRRGGALYSASFDLETFELGTDPVRVAKDVRLHDWPIHALFGTSRDGRIVYMHQQPDVVESEFVWVDMESGAIEPLGVQGILWNPELSDDGTKLAFDRSTIRNSGDVWVRDLVRGVEVQITRGPSDDSFPAWTPSGDELYFYITPSIFVCDPAGLKQPELVVQGLKRLSPSDVSGDGTKLLFFGRPGIGDSDSLRSLDLASGEVTSILQAAGGVADAQLSPDDAWFAVQLSGEDQAIVVATFPEGKLATRIPMESGGGLRWSKDGSELYCSSEDQLFAVPLEFTPGSPPVPGKVRVVVPRDSGFLFDRRFDVSIDGRRLLVVRPGTQERHEPLTLLENGVR